MTNFQKWDSIFPKENTKMQKCRFSEISTNFRMSKSVLFSRNEIAPISLQIRILRSQLGWHIFLGPFGHLEGQKLRLVKHPSHKESLLEPSVLETDRKLIFFSWLRSLLKLRENLRKYSEFLSPWFYSRHFANLNFSCFWCYSGKIIIPCTRLFDQQDRLNCKIYPKSREKSWCQKFEEKHTPNLFCISRVPTI